MSEIKKFVPFTSLLIAAERAIETERENSLFKDPYARKLAGEEAFLALDPKKNIVSKEKGIDQPEVLDYKNTILQDVTPNNNCHSIKADLRFPWIHLLLESGYCQEQPSIWLLEGLLYYLTEIEVNQLLKTISDVSAKNSYIAADLLNRKSLEGDTKIRQHWCSGFDEPETLFADHGWTASVVQPGDENAHFGRYIKKLPPRHVPDVKRVFFVTAKKQS